MSSSSKAQVADVYRFRLPWENKRVDRIIAMMEYIIIKEFVEKCFILREDESRLEREHDEGRAKARSAFRAWQGKNLLRDLSEQQGWDCPAVVSPMTFLLDRAKVWHRLVFAKHTLDLLHFPGLAQVG
jgi:hypothetical protein